MKFPLFLPFHLAFFCRSKKLMHTFGKAAYLSEAGHRERVPKPY